MDTWDIAQMMGGNQQKPTIKKKRGTVKAVNSDGTLSVLPDGSTTNITVSNYCGGAVNDRVLMIVDKTEWLAFAILGGTKIRNEIVNYKGLSIYFSQSGTSLLVQVYGTANQNIAANESMAAIIPQWFSDVYYQGYYGYVANGSGMFVVSSNNVSITAAISTGSSPRYVWVGLANSP